MGGPKGTRAKRFESGTPCKCTTLAWTAANACPKKDSHQAHSIELGCKSAEDHLMHYLPRTVVRHVS